MNKHERKKESMNIVNMIKMMGDQPVSSMLHLWIKSLSSQIPVLLSDWTRGLWLKTTTHLEAQNQRQIIPKPTRKPSKPVEQILIHHPE